jgi:hypothetical protein
MLSAKEEDISMIEALWSVEFHSNGSPGSFTYGAGVVVFETGRIFGGDGRYFYVGNYEIVNGVARATLTSTHYSGPRESIIGPDEKTAFELNGKIARDKFVVSGTVAGKPGVTVNATLTRRAELPS